MIVYNLHSLLILIFVIPTCYLLSFWNLNFTFFSKPELWSVILFYSCICVSFNIKPRIYLIPLWLFSSFIFIWRANTVYENKGLIYSSIICALFILLGVLLKHLRTTKKWNKSKEQLNDFLKKSKAEKPKLLAFYPDYIYSDNHLIQKYFNFILIKLQNRWFNKPEVRAHFLKLIEKLNEIKPQENDKNSLTYLKTILERKDKDGIPEYHFENLQKKLI